MKSFSIYLYGRDFGPLGGDFDGVSGRLAELHRMYIEPDGSFVWTGRAPLGDWQIDGMIYDAAGAVQYVDIKGRCRRSEWERLITALAPEPDPHLAVLILPGQTRKTLEEFSQDIWGQTE